MKYLSKLIQLGILLLFAGEFIAMSYGIKVVPTDAETKTYFMALHSVFLTILSVPALASMIQSADNNSFTPPSTTKIEKSEDSAPVIENKIV